MKSVTRLFITAEENPQTIKRQREETQWDRQQREGSRSASRSLTVTCKHEARHTNLCCIDEWATENHKQTGGTNHVLSARLPGRVRSSSVNNYCVYRGKFVVLLLNLAPARWSRSLSWNTTNATSRAGHTNTHLTRLLWKQGPQKNFDRCKKMCFERF